MCLAVAPEFTFVQMADTQMGFTNGNGDLAVEIQHLQTAMKMVNEIKPAFVVISGDLLNEAHSIKQTRAFWNAASGLSKDIPLHLVPGNHDLGKTTAQDIKTYRKLFGKDYYHFTHQNSDFIVMDSCLLFEPAADPEIKADQRKWFDETIAAIQKRNPAHIFICTHHAWFLAKPDEENRYENVPLTERNYYLDAFKRAGVQYALAGHVHRNGIASDGGLTVIATGAVSKNLDGSKPGFRVFTVKGDKVDSHFVELP